VLSHILYAQVEGGPAAGRPPDREDHVTPRAWSLTLAVGLGLGALGSGVRPADPAPGERVTVRVGHQATVGGTGLAIRFVGVPEDSRCPRPADCAWRGNARVELDVAAGAARPARIALHTLLKDHRSQYSPVDRYPHQAPHAGFLIRLVELEPYPVLGQPIRLDEYEVTLVVSRH
jgi:hypothetical protein